MKRIIFLLYLLLTPLLTIGQSTKETIQYIWDNLVDDNPSYENITLANSTTYEFKRNTQTLFSPYCNERINLRNAIFYYEYMPMKNSGDDALGTLSQGTIIREFGGNAYWIFDKKAFKFKWEDMNPCLPRLVVYDKDTARRITKAMNHLASLLKDPFD